MLPEPAAQTAALKGLRDKQVVAMRVISHTHNPDEFGSGFGDIVTEACFDTTGDRSRIVVGEEVSLTVG